MSNLIEWLVNILMAIIIGVQYYILVAGFLFFIDTFFKILSLKISNEKFNLKKMVGGIVLKMVIYTPMIVSIYLLDILILNDIINMFINLDHIITKIGVFILISQEIISITNSFEKLMGFKILKRTNKLWKFLKKGVEEFKDIKKG